MARSLRATVALLVASPLIGGAAHPAQAAGPIRVVAAENFWGSIASQLGGSRVQVASIITSPNTDPHSYEPTPGDARAIAGARLAIVNGVGYDPWASRLLAASGSGAVVLDVGDLVGVSAGGNPHRWYSPPDVQRVIAQISADYARLDPADAGFFRLRKARFVSQGLGRYRAEIALIKRRYHGVAVGASEGIFAPLAQALGLNLLTPPDFLSAISEGTEPTAADKRAVDRQIATRQIKVWVYNSQNSTPDVRRLTDAARVKGIPVATVTETLTPASASFQDWQTQELRALARALKQATSR